MDSELRVVVEPSGRVVVVWTDVLPDVDEDVVVAVPPLAAPLVLDLDWPSVDLASVAAELPSRRSCTTRGRERPAVPFERFPVSVSGISRSCRTSSVTAWNTVSRSNC